MERHADPTDAAADAAQFFIDDRVKNYRKKEGPEETGFCLHCKEDTPPGRRWCDADCRDKWELRRK